jgi:hydroxymethylbilane synthase
MNTLILGTRGSPLALAQATLVRGLLQTAHAGLAIEIKIIKTSGDKFTEVSLAAAGGKGLFTKEIEEHLLRSDIDLAVHSMKDLPTDLPAGLIVAAVPAREDPRDVLICKRCRSVDELPVGAHVASSSLRRRAQLLARRPDLQIEEIRGNVDTRLRKLRESTTLEATILAAAGLNRLQMWPQLAGLHYQKLESDVMIPAVGQGAIAIEARAADERTGRLLRAIDHAETHACVEAERAFLRALGGGCQVPFPAHGRVAAGQLHLVGAKFSPDGREGRRGEVTGPLEDAGALGERLAKQLLT